MSAAALIAEARERITSAEIVKSYGVAVQADALLNSTRRLADALETAEYEADALAAVVEKARECAEDHKGRTSYANGEFFDGMATGNRDTAVDVLGILSAAPADILREVKAEGWDEGVLTALLRLGNGTSTTWAAEKVGANPYRPEPAVTEEER